MPDEYKLTRRKFNSALKKLQSLQADLTESGQEKWLAQSREVSALKDRLIWLQAKN